MIPQLVAQDLKRDEGFVPHVYECPAGFQTIGYGFMVDARRGGRIPRHIANIWLEWEIEQRWAALTTELPWLEDQPEDVHRALVNMAFQLGVRGVLGFRKMLEALRVGDRKKAADEALDSTWAGQTSERARRVAALIRGGE